MSNQEDRFDFSDSENHGNQGERYRKSSEDKNDNGKADGINWGDKIFSMIQESAESMDFAELSHNIQKTIDVAREETMKQVDKARTEAAKQIDRAKEEAARQVDKAKEEAAKQIDKARGYQSSQAYVNVGHGRKVIAGKLKKNPGLYSGPAEIAAPMGNATAPRNAPRPMPAPPKAPSPAAPTAISAAAVMIPFTIVSAFLLGRGILNSKRARRIRKYASIWTGKPYVMIEDLESRVGWDRKKILKDIHFLTDRELIIGAELDAGETCLMLTDESKQQYASAMAAKRQREQEEVKAREAEEALKAAPFEQREIHRIKKDGQEYLEQLAELKKEIVSDEMRRKVEQMETLTARIFVCASEHPESISQTDRLFKYYFPSVLKLLKVYEDVEKQPVQGENIRKTKKEIEDSLDTMNQALEKLFDEMFQNVAMDISSDILLI